MDKINSKDAEPFLNDLAANIGYVLISEPFDTPFNEASIEILPDSEKVLWPVPKSILNDKEHEEFRKMCINADIIDTVCTTSFPWPSDEENQVAFILVDLTRRRRGCVKFVNFTEWYYLDETFMAAICNMLVHDMFPGENFLAFQMDEDIMDTRVDELWDEQVCIYAARDVKSLNPSDYLHKLGSDKAEMCLVSDVFDIRYPITSKDIAGLNKPAILLSTLGRLNPQVIKPGNEIKSALDDKILLVPEDGYQVDFDIALQLFGKEEVLRLLPITRKITISDIWRVQLDKSGLYTINEEEWKKKCDKFLACLEEVNRMSDKS
jgi:hypothetical protein